MRRVVSLLTIAACIAPLATHAAEPLPDRRAVRPPVVSAPSGSQETLVDLLMQLEALQTEVRQLRGQLEVQAHELERLRSGQREASADFDRRMQELERRGANGAAAGSGGTSNIVTPAVSSAPGAAAAVPVPKAPPSAAEQQEYDAAFALLKQGLYERAAGAFRKFIAHHSDGPLADNAQYWVGEASYVTRNFRVALDEFDKVIRQYPASPKVPDALLKVGYSQYELGAFDKARDALNQVIARYPNTAVAKSAELRLAKMKKENR